MGRTWTVDVDGVKHTIVVDLDSQSRRAVIRVDGRLTAKPMSADETEREVPVGSIRYVVRRLDNDAFDLDIPPEAFLDRAASWPPAQRRAGGSRPPKQEKSQLARWIGYVVLAIVVVALIRYGVRGFQYMRVPWQPYSEPDASFKVKFPAKPNDKEQTENINGDIWTVQSRYAAYKNHFYAVEYLDLKVVAVEANAEAVMTRFLRGWAASIGGTVATTEKTSLGRNSALNFEMSLPPGSGAENDKLTVRAHIRGVVAVRGRRLFIAWTLSAAADPFSTDLRQFIDSFEIPPPPPPTTFEALTVQQTVREQPAAAPPVAQPATKTIDPAATARETAARRAAEPQIYLEPVYFMYHVAGCSAVKPEMQRVSREELPGGYVAHLCVPDDVRNWQRKW